MNDIDKLKDTAGKSNFYNKFLYSTLFNLRLILKNLKHRKRSAIITALGLIFSLTILFSSSIWVHTSQNIIADDYIETLDYEMYINTFLPNAMNEVYDYLSDDSVVRQVDWQYVTYALFNFENKEQNYRVFPESEQDNLEDPISLTNAIVVPTRAIERIKLNLEIEGNASLNSGEIMVSYSEAKELERTYKKNIAPGEIITVAITRRIPNTDIGEDELRFFDIDETTYYNYTISGIFKYTGTDGIIDKLIGAKGAGNIVDSVLFPMEDLTYEDLYIFETNGLLPKLLIKTNAEKLRTGNIETMPDNLLALKERIEINYYHTFCRILKHEIETMANEYKRTFSSAVLFIPAIAATLILTVLATQMTIKRRGKEIALLRSRGASSVQIIGVFFSEYSIIGIFSLLVSFGLSIFTAAAFPLIAGGESITAYNLSRFMQYLDISAYEIEIFSVIVLGIYLGVTFVNIVSFVKKDVQEGLLITRKGQRILSLGVNIAVFVLVFVGFILLLLEFRKVFDPFDTYGFDSIERSSMVLLAFMGAIFFICYYISMGIVLLLQKTPKIYRLIFKNGGFFIYHNIKRKTKTLTELTFFLILIISLLTFLISIRSITETNIELENNYRNGSDIRVQTTVPINISEYNERFSKIEGIKDSLGFYSLRATIGTQDVEVFGVDPLKYLSVGNWIDHSFQNTTAEEALTALEETLDGLILSDYTASRLRLSVGRHMFITDFKSGPFSHQFQITGIISSAPGLGVAHGNDPKMVKSADEYVLVNQEILQAIGVENGSLFLLSVGENVDINQIKEQIQNISPLLIVNPEKINPNYIGYFITKYIPHVSVILLLGIIVISFVAIVYIFISTEFILNQRRKEHAVLLALGGKQTKIRGLVIGEILVFVVSTTLIGIPVGFLTALSSLSFIKPLLIPREIVPIVFNPGILMLLVVILSLALAALITIIPLIKKQTKFEIVHELRITE